MKKYKFLFIVLLLMVATVLTLHFSRKKNDVLDTDDRMKSDITMSRSADAVNTDKYNSIKKRITASLLENPIETKFNSDFAIDESEAFNQFSRFLSLVDVEISKSNVDIYPMKLESNTCIWSLEDNNTGLKADVDAQSGMLLSVSGDIDIYMTEDDAIALCKKYAMMINSCIDGLFYDDANYYVTSLIHKMSSDDASMKQIEVMYYSKENDVMIFFSNHFTRFSNGDVANIKSADHYLGINIAVDANKNYCLKKADYIYNADIVADIDENTTAEMNLTESEARKIVLRDIEKINSFLPDKIDINNCTLESLGVNRISGARCLQSLFGFTLIENDGRRVMLFIEPQLRKITHIIYDVNKKYTTAELKTISDNFSDYLGFKSNRCMYGVYDDLSVAGNYLYNLDNSDYNKNSIMAVESGNRLYLYLSNNTKYNLWED